MLERGDGRQTGRLLQFFHKLPRIERIKKIYISGSARKYFNREVAAVAHINACGLLIGITAVFEFEFFHDASPYLFLFMIRVSSLPLSRSV